MKAKLEKIIKLMKKNKRFKIFVIAVLSVIGTVLVLAAAFTMRGIEASKTLSIAISSEPPKLDPAFCSGTDYGTLMVNTFEGLMTVDENGDLQPAQASNYTVSSDGLTYTFLLSENAKWSNGSPVLAEDFVYAWRRAANPDNNTEYRSMFENIQGYNDIYTTKETDTGTTEAAIDMTKLQIYAQDSRTLVVHLMKPDPEFLDKCAFPAFFPVCKNAISDNSRVWSTNTELFVSNGAYVLTGWESGKYLTLSKNSYYSKSNSKSPSSIKVYFTEDANKALSYYHSKKIQFTNCIPDEALKKAKKNRGFHIAPLSGSYFLSFNTKAAPLNDKRVRQALCLAIDRNKIIKEITDVYGIAADALISDGFSSAQAGVSFRDAGKSYIDLSEKKYKQNAEQAKALLAEAGYEDGGGFPEFTYLYNDNVYHKKIAQAVIDMWKDVLGIDCTLVGKDWSTFLDNRSNGNYLAAKDGIIVPYNNTYTMLSAFTSENSYCGWENTDYDGLISSIEHAGDRKTQLTYSAQAEDLLMENWVVCPLFYYTQPYLASGKLTNYYIASSGFAYFNNVVIKI